MLPLILLAAIAIDGDTLRIDDRRIRLSAIDAPELSQTCRDATGGADPMRQG